LVQAGIEQKAIIIPHPSSLDQVSRHVDEDLAALDSFFDQENLTPSDSFSLDDIQVNFDCSACTLSYRGKVRWVYKI
jgi:hypothetical protein